MKKSKLGKYLAEVVGLTMIVGIAYLGWNLLNREKAIRQQVEDTNKVKKILEETQRALVDMESQDQYKINQGLAEEVKQIKATFGKTVDAYEDMLDMEIKIKDTKSLKEKFASVLYYISEFNLASASASLTELESEIKKTEAELAKAVEIPKEMALAPEKNAPPESGYSRQKVVTDAGSFVVSIISADLSSTKVIIATGSNSDCKDNCPVKSLSTYVSENGAYAGINGTYFCPSTYPDCQAEKNSFDLLVMNKDKTYLNSDNNVYSSNPAVIFGDNYVRFVTSVSQWGRDTTVNGVISNYPLLVNNSQVVFGGDTDPKKGSKGNRSFVANIGNKVYIGVVHNATVTESALTVKTMGMENAMNLDNGGSTALWNGGYKVGPGRDLPNVILFVKK